MDSEDVEKIQESEDEKYLEKPAKPVKAKRQQTEAQKENTKKMREALLLKHEASRKAKEQLQMEKLAKAEQRIVKKARR